MGQNSDPGYSSAVEKLFSIRSLFFIFGKERKIGIFFFFTFYVNEAAVVQRTIDVVFVNTINE